MKYSTDLPERLRKTIADSGEILLKSFHDAYEQNPVGAETEFWRGQFSCWKQMLNMIYGQSIAEPIILGVSKKTRLSIPPAGLLAPDGDGYIGWDSNCHMGYIGKFE